MKSVLMTILVSMLPVIELERGHTIRSGCRIRGKNSPYLRSDRKYTSCSISDSLHNKGFCMAQDKEPKA